MQINTLITNEIEPAQLATALANSTPHEFAEFWFAFAGKVKDEKLREFAKAMSPDLGSARKEPLTKLYKYMICCEIRG